MVKVSQETANWRLFGGGGLLVGGILWALGAVLAAAAVLSEVSGWVIAVGVVVVAVAHLFVAFGQTGSNGAVGALLWGKIALVIAALGWALAALVPILVDPVSAEPTWLAPLATALIVLAGLIAAIAIFSNGVAKGFAQWALFVPVAAYAVVFFLPLAGVEGLTWAPIVVAVLVALTGLAYLFNKADVPR